MPQAGIILYLRPLRPVSFILARRSFHKFYFTLEKKFAQITFHISILDPWLESGQIQKLLSHLLVKANRFILTIDGWLDEGLLDGKRCKQVMGVCSKICVQEKRIKI